MDTALVLLDHLTQRHAALHRRLQKAYAMTPWPTRLIDRIADRLAAVEREIARTPPRDGHAGRR